jgi:hypothetical protein
MITLFRWDDRGLFLGTVEVDESADLPTQATPKPVPKLTGDQVAYWDGEGWQVLASTPQVTTPVVDWPALIAARRYAAEVAGTVWLGFGIATDRESQNKVDQELRAVERGLREDGAGWKCLDLATGLVGFRPTSNAEVAAIAGAVYRHVSRCFQREGASLATVRVGKYSAELLAEEWPV